MAYNIRLLDIYYTARESSAIPHKSQPGFLVIAT